jgi:phosphomannomutase
MDYSILSRSYDLRGIYGVDIDDDFFFRLGYAFAKVTGKSHIALGYDARLSSPALKTAFTRGASLAWATVIDIGLCSSDMLSFATCHYDDIEAGGMITASHNPKEYNGFKCLSHTGEPYNFKKYGSEMVKIMEWMNDIELSSMSTPQKIEQRNVLEDWTDHIISFVGKDTDFSQYTIVADGGNGSAWAFMARLSEKAGFTMIPLYLGPDGNFPHHHPNPMLEKNREDAKWALLENKANAAFIFDGDADRIVILDEKWDQVNSAIISAVIADALLEREPGANFIGNAVASHNFRDLVREKWREYIREMVWHVYIRETMMKDRSIAYAWEHSAHYFFRDNYFMDSGIVAGMVFLSVVARSGHSISEFTQRYIRYISLEETNFEVPDPKAAIQKLIEIYKYEKYDLFDGITVEYDDGSWWNFRPSSNEPLLRLNMEAQTQERFDALYAEIMEHIRIFWEASED